jgi:hypothetical protein
MKAVLYALAKPPPEWQIIHGMNSIMELYAPKPKLFAWPSNMLEIALYALEPRL